MGDNQTPEQKKAAFEKKVKIGAAVCAGLLFAPIAVAAIGGLVGLIVAAAIAVVGINLAPVFAMKMANLKMKLIMAEAQKNPILTMRNIYVDNMHTIAEKDEKIKAFAARLGDFKDKAIEFAKHYPEEAPRYQEVANKMAKVLERQKQKQKAAKISAQNYKANIDKAEAIYEMALAANEVQKLGGTMEKQVFDDIKKQVAFDSVNHQFNTAVAELTIEADTEPDFSLSTGVSSLPSSEIDSYNRPQENVKVNQA